MVFVVADANRGWILEAICTELAERSPAPSQVHYGLRPLPKAGAYFFSHYSLHLRCLGDRALQRADAYVLFTHPSFRPGELEPAVAAMSQCRAVISLCSVHAQFLVDAGLPAERVEVAIPGVDPDRFPPHRRGEGAVGLCSAYYPRKAPETVLELVRALPDRPFRLLGRGWREAPLFADLDALPNFTYLEDAYENYPAFYDGIDIFVSTSTLEGGPTPLIEAMMANCVPVASRTGYAPDVIDDGRNGFLVDVGAPGAVYAERVEAAFAVAPDVDIRATVDHLTWDAFAAKVLAITGQA